LFDKGEHEPKKTSFKEAVKDLGTDGKISNKDYKELVDTYGEKKVANKLEKVSDKNDIKIGKKPSESLGIQDTKTETKAAKTEPTVTEPTVTEPTVTEDKPSFKKAVKELGADGKINNKDYKELVETYGEEKVEKKLEKVADKKDIKIGNKPSEALGITKPDDTASSDDSKISFRKAVAEYGKDGKINNKDYNDLVNEYGQEKVDKKLEKVADKKDIKIGNRPSEALGIEPEIDIYKDEDLNINEPEQADPPPKVKNLMNTTKRG
jgi:putative transposon-encoded protein